MKKKVDFKKTLTEAFKKLIEKRDCDCGCCDDVENMEEGPNDFMFKKPPGPPKTRKLPTRISGTPSTGASAEYRDRDLAKTLDQLASVLGNVPLDRLSSSGKLDFDKVKTLMGLGMGVSEKKDDKKDKKAKGHAVPFDNLEPLMGERGCVKKEGIGTAFAAPLAKKALSKMGQEIKKGVSKIDQVGQKTFGSGASQQAGSSQEDDIQVAYGLRKDPARLPDAYDPIHDDDPMDREEPLSIKKVLGEKAPPSEKAEEFITKNKDNFKKRYGARWKEVLYSTAHKMFPSK